jgi:threonine dehydrogenase-like Zn-dependent dehydrogenase
MEIPDPPLEDGSILVETAAVGVCGTDGEILSGQYGEAPEGEERLVLGHESIGRVREAPPGCGLSPGDWVAGIVRRPDPVPCSSCAAGEWDMCRNGLFTERGIKGRHGFASQRFRIEPEFAVRVDPALGAIGVLLEPASIVAKAWEHIEHIGSRAHWAPRRVLVTGAGPIGFLAALFGKQRGLEVHLFDRNKKGVKPELAYALGAAYHTGSIETDCPRADVVIEATGAPPVVMDAMRHNARHAIVCLTGISSGGREFSLDVGGLSTKLVLENDVVFGSVNANRRHFEAAAAALAGADRRWLEGLITRRLPLDRWSEMMERDSTRDVKTILDFAA